MQARTIFVLILAAVLGALLAIYGSNIVPVHWQLAIGAAVAALIVMEFMRSWKGQVGIIIVSAGIAVLLDQGSAGQNFWADLGLWSFVAGALAVLLVSFVPRSRPKLAH